ncbi:P-II family nitrogen regulator [Amphibacillus indicireducens]|uniref:Transcriptional regulator n=1 Tax=Amphibacillus indicireducens TaxID=1076330 RepID=A0ABP7W469_9BACI
MLKQVEKLIIITERIIISKIIKYIESLEIKAYTIYHDVSGQGQRGMRSVSGGLSRLGENIRIEIIIEDEEQAVEVAEKIYNKYLSSRYAGIVYLEKIRVVK